MKLEVIERKYVAEPRGTIVLVHGACFAAWCWEENLLPFFAEAGYQVKAMSLRNHGGSDHLGSLKFRRIREYVDDLRQIVATCEGPVYLLGHSMGGFVIQHFLNQSPELAAKAILVCSIPPHGVWRLTLKTMLNYPLVFLKANLTWSLKPVFGTVDRCNRYIFSGQESQDRAAQVLSRMQDESFLSYLDTLILDLPTKPNHKVPVMVVGGEVDFLFNHKDVQATARAYGVEPVWVANGSHNWFMQEGWELTAEKMVEWLRN
ncbi:alpha/beta hydrolase [Flavihumibacter rivuli]|uniref:alpha/beta hydrolase n=1 Tax=Flavihumibacter rivuli TaxID=2838156 RepID=UPI001BDEE15C|nr:alpha/beta hydrolase [Flavihumibacter rivuli]ULQ56072.1 alpha/beta hydrolase [Flavihumibacter rivuli]